MCDHFQLLLVKKSTLLKTNGHLKDLPTIGNENSLNWSSTWMVNYDDRMRNVSTLFKDYWSSRIWLIISLRYFQVSAEISHASAIKQIRTLQQILISNSQNTDLMSVIHLQATVNADSYVAPMHFKSTYGRELWFCCLHAVSLFEFVNFFLFIITYISFMSQKIHHYALIKVICTEQNVSCLDDFGVAPSTLRSIKERESITLYQ